jgi:hypothetical protein
MVRTYTCNWYHWYTCTYVYPWYTCTYVPYGTYICTHVQYTCTYHGTYVLIMLCHKYVRTTLCHISTYVRTYHFGTYVQVYVHVYTCTYRDTFNGDTNHHWLLLLVDP